MYIPKHFEEPRIEVMHDLIRAWPLCTLVTLASGGLDANHIPLHLSDDPAPLGALRGHVARANPLWCDTAPDSEVLAIFHGPEAYITPSWYATKAETGKAVPTWNYAVVHAHGRLRVIDDASWVRSMLEAQTAHTEAASAAPWRLSDAPTDYTEKLLAAVVGIEITITRMSGKWKLSQNQPDRNQESVVHGLRARGDPKLQEMATWVEDARTPP
jgi:transcriptional regulator